MLKYAMIAFVVIFVVGLVHTLVKRAGTVGQHDDS